MPHEKNHGTYGWKARKMLVEKEVGGGGGGVRGLGGRDSCIVSLHAPVTAVIPALCLSLSTGDVWPEAGNSRGQRIFQTTALQWAAIQGRKK